MTSLETFQVPKPRFEGQNHGTRGNTGVKFQKQQDEYAYHATTITENNARFDTYLRSEAIETGLDDYLNSLTSEQLEHAADEILDASESTIFTLEQWKAKQEKTFKVKLNEYKRLYDLHLELATQLASDPTNAELATLKEKIGNQAQQLEDSFGSESWTDETPPTVNEIGRKTEKQLNQAFLDAATSQYNPDDEVLDYDGDSHIRVTMKSPFSK